MCDTLYLKSILFYFITALFICLFCNFLEAEIFLQPDSLLKKLQNEKRLAPFKIRSLVAPALLEKHIYKPPLGAKSKVALSKAVIVGTNPTVPFRKN